MIFRINKLVWLFFLTGGFFKTSAQSVDSTFKRFGFQIGMNLSNMNFNAVDPAPAVKSNASWQTGITFGFQLKVPLAKKLLLQPEYSFSQRNGSDLSIPAGYTINYFSLPVLLNYQLSRRFYILAGPQFEITTSATTTTNGETTTITHNVEERGIGVAGGLEFTLIKSVFIAARYYQGLNHVGLYQRTNVKEFEYQSFIFTAGIRF